MNNVSQVNESGSSKIWKGLFIALLGIQAALELGIGVSLLTNFKTTLETGFGITYSQELDVLGLALGLYLLLLTALLVLSLVWTLKGNYAGSTIGMIIGMFLMVFGVATLFQSGEMQGIIVDGIRGLVTFVLAFVVGKQLKK